MPELDAERREQLAEALLSSRSRGSLHMLNVIAPLIAGWLAEAEAGALREAADELDATWNAIDREHPAGSGSPDPYWEGRLAGIEQAETQLRDRADRAGEPT